MKRQQLLAAAAEAAGIVVDIPKKPVKNTKMKSKQCKKPKSDKVQLELPTPKSPATSIPAVSISPSAAIIEQLPLLDGLDELLFPVYEKPSQLILGYTYFFNDMSKYISVGYSTPDITPVVVLHHINKGAIVLTPYEWFTMFMYIAEFEEVFNSNNTGFIMSSKRLSNVTSVEHDVIMGEIILIKENVCFQINKDDWSDILQKNDFFKSIIISYTHSLGAVKDYYIIYLNKCVEKNVLYLDASMFFTPSEDMKHLCNFTRLFYEIGHICKRNTNINNIL